MQAMVALRRRLHQPSFRAYRAYKNCHLEACSFVKSVYKNSYISQTTRPMSVKFSSLVVIHQSPDTSNHRTPSKYRTEIQVIPTSIHLRLLPAESAFTAARNAHLLHQGFDCRARQAGHFTHVELAVLFSRLYEVQIHRYSTYMCLAANPGE